MKNNKSSKTADLTAAIRARHYTHDSNLIFEDPLASKLINKPLSFFVKRKVFNWLVHSSFVPDIKGSESLVLYRADYIERQLENAIQAGCTQYIIIAAGMDSYAYRCQSANNALNVEA